MVSRVNPGRADWRNGAKIRKTYARDDKHIQPLEVLAQRTPVISKWIWVFFFKRHIRTRSSSTDL